jgi:hypothetical protein
VREVFFYCLRDLFNDLNFDLTPINKVEEEALAVLKKVRALFNRDFYSISIAEFDEIAEDLKYVQDRMELFKGLGEKAKLN